MTARLSGPLTAHDLDPVPDCPSCWTPRRSRTRRWWCWSEPPERASPTWAARSLPCDRDRRLGCPPGGDGQRTGRHGRLRRSHGRARPDRRGQGPPQADGRDRLDRSGARPPVGLSGSGTGGRCCRQWRYLFETDAAVCRRRNAERDRSVPARVLTAQLRAVRELGTVLADEGWDVVHRVVTGHRENDPAAARRTVSTSQPEPTSSDGFAEAACK